MFGQENQNAPLKSSRQLEKLRGFITTPTYQEAMAEEETYYRLARIYEFLGEPAERIAGAYLYASWETPYDDVFLFARKFALESRDQTDLIAAQAHYLWYIRAGAVLLPCRAGAGPVSRKIRPLTSDSNAWRSADWWGDLDKRARTSRNCSALHPGSHIWPNYSAIKPS